MQGLGDKLRNGIFISLFISLAIYHLGNILQTSYLPQGNNFLGLVNVIQLGISIAVYFLIVFNKLTARLILRDRYIGGVYEGKGTSTSNKDSTSIERFVVSQNLTEVTLSGKSFQPETQKIQSIWTGRLFKVEGDTYYFGLDVAFEGSEVGVLRVTIDGDDAYGFYYSGNPDTTGTHSFSVEKNKQSAMQIFMDLFS